MVAAKKTTKRAPVKKAVTKKPASKAASHKKAHRPEWKTGKLGPDVRPFFSFTVTSQTIVWATIMVFVLILQLAILFKELDILDSLS